MLETVRQVQHGDAAPSWLAHLACADIGIRGLQQCALSESGESEVVLGDARIGTTTIHHEISDEMAATISPSIPVAEITGFQSGVTS
jgi:hypothetical protein